MREIDMPGESGDGDVAQRVVARGEKGQNVRLEVTSERGKARRGYVGRPIAARSGVERLKEVWGGENEQTRSCDADSVVGGAAVGACETHGKAGTREEVAGLTQARDGIREQHIVWGLEQCVRDEAFKDGKTGGKGLCRIRGLLLIDALLRKQMAGGQGGWSQERDERNREGHKNCGGRDLPGFWGLEREGLAGGGDDMDCRMAEGHEADRVAVGGDDGECTGKRTHSAKQGIVGGA
jgi:hypothetical protein